MDVRAAVAFKAGEPLSIETVDSKVLMLAMRDIVWHGVARYFPEQADTPTLGINLIEFSGDDQEEREQQRIGVPDRGEVELPRGRTAAGALPDLQRRRG